MGNSNVNRQSGDGMSESFLHVDGRQYLQLVTSLLRPNVIRNSVIHKLLHEALLYSNVKNSQSEFIEEFRRIQLELIY